eukprot:292023-Amphidinium_carterae.1
MQQTIEPQSPKATAAKTTAPNGKQNVLVTVLIQAKTDCSSLRLPGGSHVCTDPTQENTK